MNIRAIASSERFRRFKERTGYSADKLAEIFDVDPCSIRNWLSGRSEMRREYLQTLLRLECDYLAGPQSPLSPEAREAFVEGRHGQPASV